MLKFVQWSVLELLMPNGLREGLKALSLLLLGYKWTYKRVAKCSAVLCGLPDESNVSPVNSKLWSVLTAPGSYNAEDGSHARLWSALAYFDKRAACLLLSSVFTRR